VTPYSQTDTKYVNFVTLYASEHVMVYNIVSAPKPLYIFIFRGFRYGSRGILFGSEIVSFFELRV